MGGEGSGDLPGHEFHGNQWMEGGSLPRTSIKEKTIHVELPKDKDITSYDIKKHGTMQERKAIGEYKSYTYGEINKKLREGKLDTTYSDIRDDVRNIDNVLLNSVIKKDVVVYRGIRDSVAYKIKETNECNNQGYTSTSLNPWNAAGFANYEAGVGGAQNIMVFKVPAGSKGYVYPDDNEHELLLPRGLKLKCTGIEEIGELNQYHPETKETKEYILKHGNIRLFTMEIQE